MPQMEAKSLVAHVVKTLSNHFEIIMKYSGKSDGSAHRNLPILLTSRQPKANQLHYGD